MKHKAQKTMGAVLNRAMNNNNSHPERTVVVELKQQQHGQQTAGINQKLSILG